MKIILLISLLTAVRAQTKPGTPRPPVPNTPPKMPVVVTSKKLTDQPTRPALMVVSSQKAAIAPVTVASRTNNNNNNGSKPCAEAPMITNGQIVFIDTGIVVYGCKANYVLVGSKTIECKSDGLWSERPYCARATTTTLTPGSTKKFELPPFLLTPKATTPKLLAQTTTTTPPPMTTPRATTMKPTSPLIVQQIGGMPKGGCPDPPTVENGTIEFADPGVFVVYSCINDLVLVGDANIYCGADGKWSEPPVCIKETSCGLLPVVDGAVISESNLVPGAMSRVGSYAMFNCPKLGTSVRIECLAGGSWSATPNCASKPPVRLTTVPPSPSTTRLPATTSAAEQICPNRPLTHLVFLFDLLIEEGAEQQLRAITTFLETLSFRQSMTEYTGAHPPAFTLGAVALFEQTSSSQARPAVSTTLSITSDLSSTQVNVWSSWIENNVLLMKNAFDDDVSTLLQAVPNVVGLGQLSLAYLYCGRGLDTTRIVYVSNAKRGAAIVRAASSSHSIRRSGGKIFVLGFGDDMGSQRQQTVLKMRVATQPNYFKFMYAPDPGQLESLMADPDFQDFLRFGTKSS